MTNTENLTIDNFTNQTGFRFRVSRDQKARIDAGEITREQAFQEFLSSGGLERLESRLPEIPDSVYLDPTLTLENFSERVEAAIGVPRRFRVNQSQANRIALGDMTRAQALAEVVEQRRVANENTNSNSNQFSFEEV